MNHAVEKPETGRRGAARIMTAVLSVLFLLGAALILAALRGQEAYARSGIQSSSGSEKGYQLIHTLSGDVGENWEQVILPTISGLEAEERAALEETARTLAMAKWDEMKAGGGEEAAALLEQAGGRREEVTWRMLYATWLVDGPKIALSSRKEIIAVSEDAAPAFRAALLRCALKEEAEVPAAAAKAVGEKKGAERQGLLIQAFFVSGGSAEGKVSEHADALKKAVRGKEQRLSAYGMIARGEGGWFWSMLVSHSRTAILIGALLMINAVLLFFLMRSQGDWGLNAKWILMILILDFLLVFQVLPSFTLIRNAFVSEKGFSLDIMRSLYTNPANLGALKNTLIASFATMILGTLIAFPLAWLVGRTNLYGKNIFRFLFVTTYMVPPYVGAMAWMRLLNPNVGVVNKALRTVLGLSVTQGPLDIYTLGGMIWVLTSFYYPYAFITISRAMEKMDPSLEEASRISGASPLKTVFTVTLPMMMPSLVAGALLVFISAASCYGIPSIIGNPGNIYTVTTRIAEQVGLPQGGMENAAGLGVFLMAIGLIVLFISDGLLARKQYTTVSGKSVNPVIVDLGKWRIPLTVGMIVFVLIMVVMPFMTILNTSFKIDVGKSVLAARNFTLDNWRDVFTRSKNLNALRNSLVYASIAATAGLVIACVMSYLLQRTSIRGRSIPNFLITLGSGTPSVVIALSLIMAMNGRFGLNLIGTAQILIIAYMIKYEMMGMRTVTSAMAQIHVSLEESSQIAGASWLSTMRRITGPLIFPSIAAGWFLIFIPCFYELSMTELLFASGTETIGHQLFEYWTLTSQPMSCAMAFGILMIVVVLNLVLNLLTKGKFSI